jgi:hypothetical protein
MKHTLLGLSLAVLITSCGQTDSERTVTLQRQVDSLVKLVPAKFNHVELNAANAGQAPFAPLPISDYYMPRYAADQQIQAYHALFVSGGSHRDAIIPGNNLGRSSFIIPANTLQQIVNDSACPFVVFYIGYDKEKANISLIYTGIRPVEGYADSFNEITFSNPQIPDSRMVFDNAWPCPKCSGIGPHSVSGTQATAIYASSGPNGSISPAGPVVTVPYNHNVQFTMTPADQSQQIDSVIVDGRLIQNPPNPYPFDNVTQTHTFRVTFKPAGQ